MALASGGGSWRLAWCRAFLPALVGRNRLAALAPQRVVPLEPGDEIAGPEILSRLRAASPIVAQAAPELRDACGRVALLQRLGQVALPHITLVRRSRLARLAGDPELAVMPIAIPILRAPFGSSAGLARVHLKAGKGSGLLITFLPGLSLARRPGLTGPTLNASMQVS